MYPVCVALPNVLAALADLDHRVAQEVRQRRCGTCGGPLHFATWTRKPRGGPDGLATRWGLCCGHCRKRTLPPSVLFNGRRVYLKAVVLLVVAARQRDRVGVTLARIRALFGVSADTVRRWLRAFALGLADHPVWRRRRGRIPPTIVDLQVPAALLDALLPVLGVNTALITACQWVPDL